ncbi:hypothetical protein HK096_008084, partial [Nowakowskiella sp. JEL0078]
MAEIFSAYTLFGIVMQLLSCLLFEKNDVRSNANAGFYWDWSLGSILKGRKTGQLFVCGECGYDSGEIIEAMGKPQKSWIKPKKIRKNKLSIDLDNLEQVNSSPELKQESQNNIDNLQIPSKPEDELCIGDLEAKKRATILLSRIPNHIWLSIASYLTNESLIKALQIPHLGHLIRRFNLHATINYRCFFTRNTYDDTILGFGIHIDNSSTTRRTFNSQFEYLSIEAFRGYHIRRSVWWLPFEYFLPFAICATHFERAFGNLVESVRGLEAEVPMLGLLPLIQEEPPVEALLRILVRFMVDVVNMLASEVIVFSATFASVRKAVFGFTSLQHLALSVMMKFPKITRYVDKQINKNISIMREGGDIEIGEVIFLLGLSDSHKWSLELSEELLRAYPHLHFANMCWEKKTIAMPDKSWTNLERNAMELFLLQIHFLTTILQSKNSLKSLYLNLEQNFGQPSDQMYQSTIEAISWIKTE